MSSTLLRSMKAYQCRGEREMIYALITDTAESNLHPICYNHWPIAAGRKYEVMKTICQMAADVYGGMLKAARPRLGTRRLLFRVHGLWREYAETRRRTFRPGSGYRLLQYSLFQGG
ncbi:MAG: hypothetical protein L6W00_20435 [Lentisphaeria bacterium]|nr:MAG: hypothetical protein L6W00_20435 [Lentisphaeria bacterium]